MLVFGCRVVFVFCLCGLLNNCDFFYTECEPINSHKKMILFTSNDSLTFDVWLGRNSQDQDSSYLYIRPEIIPSFEQLTTITNQFTPLTNIVKYANETSDSLVSMVMFYSKRLSSGDSINDTSLIAGLCYYKGKNNMYVKAFEVKKNRLEELEKMHMPIGTITTNDYVLFADWLLENNYNIKFISTIDFTNNYALNNQPRIPSLSSNFKNQIK
jgi:hypothetical protein